MLQQSKKAIAGSQAIIKFYHFIKLIICCRITHTKDIIIEFNLEAIFPTLQDGQFCRFWKVIHVGSCLKELPQHSKYSPELIMEHKVSWPRPSSVLLCHVQWWVYICLDAITLWPPHLLDLHGQCNEPEAAANTRASASGVFKETTSPEVWMYDLLISVVQILAGKNSNFYL